ncbi:MAG: nucleoside deaminase [Aquihabitans sp.]
MADQPIPITDDEAMVVALQLAREADAAGEVPVGAVVVFEGVVVASRRNEREASGDPTAHAEMLAIRDAAAAIGDRRLHDATLVVTLEPCPLCAGAVWAAQVGRVVFGAADLKAGAMGSLYNLAVDQRLNHSTEVVTGVRAAESAELLTAFFAARRRPRS